MLVEGLRERWARWRTWRTAVQRWRAAFQPRELAIRALGPAPAGSAFKQQRSRDSISRRTRRHPKNIADRAARALTATTIGRVDHWLRRQQGTPPAPAEIACATHWSAGRCASNLAPLGATKLGCQSPVMGSCAKAGTIAVRAISNRPRLSRSSTPSTAMPTYHQTSNRILHGEPLIARSSGLAANAFEGGN
jgi:hypothetical protein